MHLALLLTLKKQVETNIDPFFKGPVRYWRTCMKAFMIFMERLYEKFPNIFYDEAFLSKIELFEVESTKFRDVLVEESEKLSAHTQFIGTLLESIHINSFSFTSVNVRNYFQKYGQYLDLVLNVDDNFTPDLPIKIPSFLDLHDTEIEINDIKDFTRFKTEYKKITTNIVSKLQEKLPIKWPQSLPNLSTHTGKPILCIRDQDDYIQVLCHYNQYITKLDNIRDDWDITLRLLIPGILLTQKIRDLVQKL